MNGRKGFMLVTALPVTALLLLPLFGCHEGRHSSNSYRYDAREHSDYERRVAADQWRRREEDRRDREAEQRRDRERSQWRRNR